MKLTFALLLLAGLCAVYAEEDSNEAFEIELFSGDGQFMEFAKMIYKQLCKPQPGENRCVELTKETYKQVLAPYRPEIKAKCKEWKAAGKFWLHWPCIGLIKTIPKEV